MVELGRVSATFLANDVNLTSSTDRPPLRMDSIHPLHWIHTQQSPAVFDQVRILHRNVQKLC